MKNCSKAQRLWIQYKEAMAPLIEELEGGGSLSRVSANLFMAQECKTNGWKFRNRAKALQGVMFFCVIAVPALAFCEFFFYNISSKNHIQEF